MTVYEALMKAIDDEKKALSQLQEAIEVEDLNGQVKAMDRVRDCKDKLEDIWWCFKKLGGSKPLPFVFERI